MFRIARRDQDDSQVRRLPVLNRVKRLVGVISRDDLYQVRRRGAA
jgi:CBS domain-containing protein